MYVSATRMYFELWGLRAYACALVWQVVSSNHYWKIGIENGIIQLTAAYCKINNSTLVYFVEDYSPSTCLLVGNSTVYWTVIERVSSGFSSNLHSMLFWVFSLGLGGGAFCFCLAITGSVSATYIKYRSQRNGPGRKGWWMHGTEIMQSDGYEGTDT